MNPNEIQIYYGSADVSSDGGALSVQTVFGSAGTNSQFGWIDASGEDWTFAQGFFAANTTTAALRNQFFTVEGATANLIIVSKPLPASPVSGDTFYLVKGIKYRTSTRPPLRLVDGLPPELSPVALSYITGVTITQGHGDVDLRLSYDSAAQMLYLRTVTGTVWGVGLDVSSNVTDGWLGSVDGEWLVVDVTASSLPVADAVETLLITDPYWSVVPPMRINSTTANHVLHRFLCVLNESGSGELPADMGFTMQFPSGSAEVGTTYTEGDTQIILDNVSGLPARDFWLFRKGASPDIRYVRQRYGNTCILADTYDWVEVEFTTGVSEPTIGDAILDTLGSGGTLRATYVTSGSWTGGDAAGKMVISDIDAVPALGLLKQGSTTIATATSSVRSIRGIERTSSWTAADEVQCFPPYDIGWKRPYSALDFEESVGPETTVYDEPWVWTENGTEYSPMRIVLFDSGDLVSIFVSQSVLEDMRGNDTVDGSLFMEWDE